MTNFKPLFKTTALATCAAALVFAAVPAHAADKTAFTPEQQTQLKDMMRDFIMENPEVMIESINKMKAKEEQDQNASAIQSLDKHRAFLYNNPDMPSTGNPKGDITIVEFFDYNCGYCKRAYEAVQQTLDADKNVRFVFVELPILSPQSKIAANYAMAAHKQGKYFEFHRAVMNSSEPKTEEMLQRTGKELGLDVEKLKKDANSDETKALLEKKTAVAQDLHISGTPGFIIGDQIIRGYVPYEGMKPMIADARKAGK